MNILSAKLRGMTEKNSTEEYGPLIESLCKWKKVGDITELLCDWLSPVLVPKDSSQVRHFTISNYLIISIKL